MHYNRSVAPFKFYPMHHSESFHPLLLPFLTDWLMKRWEIVKDVLINCKGFHLLHHKNGRWMWTWLWYLLKLLTSAKLLLCIDSSYTHTDFMCKLACVLGLLFGNTATDKIDIKMTILILIVKTFHHTQFKSWTTQYVRWYPGLWSRF